MRIPTPIAVFAAGLGLAFGAAVLVGAAVPAIHDDGAGAAGHGHPAAGARSPRGGGHAAAAPAGLAVAEGGLRLAPDATHLPAGRDVTWSFRVLGPDGRAVTRFDTAHGRRMHLIVVRRDLTGYRHLHPAMDADGRWSVRLRLAEAGVHGAYADFPTAGDAHTLAADLLAPGAFAPRPLPPSAPLDATAGDTARLEVDGAGAGGTAALTYRLGRDGSPLDGVEPYLGADGHLAALREGDLAFLHVHPEPSGAPGTARFGATLPSPGRYRLFLQFEHDGAVRTVTHTLVVPR